MQERVRAVEFVLGHCGLPAPAPAPRPSARSRSTTAPPPISAADVLRAGVEAWPHALVERGDHEA